MLQWRATVNTDGREQTLTGLEDVPAQGGVHIVQQLPQGFIQGVSGTINLSVEADERIFMNGYQSWTSCPELGKKDRIRGLQGLPRMLVDKQALDRCGDYLFTPYPSKPGLSHGFSWCYFRRGDRYRLIASLDETPGYTMFQYDSGKSLLTIDRDCAGLACGGEHHLFDLYFAEGTEQQVFDGWFSALGLPAPTAPPLRGYHSGYGRSRGLSLESLRADLEGCKKHMAPGDLFLIGDGWESAVGDWFMADRERFPRGLTELVEEIHAAGFQAGLWLAPFIAQRDSALVQLHPDWLLRRGDEPFLCAGGWGGVYALDAGQPEVMDYLRRVLRRVTDEWGFDLVKLDFLYAAAPFGTEEETRAGRMIRVLELLKSCCGRARILGSGVPLMPAFGRVDYCRVGCDAGPDWDGSRMDRRMHRERTSTRNAILNSFFRRQLHRRAFMSGADLFFLREEDIHLTPDQKQLLGQTAALLGGVMLTSDDMGAYRTEQSAQYRELIHLQSAQNVRADPDGFLIRYTLDGRKHLLSLPKEWFK